MSIDATYWCDTCQREIPGTQAEEIRSGNGFVAVCSTCHRTLRATAADRTERPFVRVLASAFGYAFRPAILGSMAATVILAALLALVPVAGGVFAAVVQVSYLFGVLRASSAGEEELTVALEDVSDFAGFLAPLGRYLITLFLAALPAVLLAFGTRNPVLTGLGALLGVVYLPAGLIVAAHGSGCLGPLNPAPAVQIIRAIPVPYTLTVGFVVVTGGLGVGLDLLGDAAAKALARVPLLPGFLQAMLTLLPAVIVARMLGLLVYEHGDEI
ncbi:hypothetical protein [Chondromyces apiculatus]|uniref:Uncharacterized protein n=1 Tax=Chondromyces apiculatus DSM 436 TaxID=1192034 RepID=A0A017T4C2_9BACT|nr:hypothetical protein [Chondromyces apiculatus]EYF03660.1 Hypothetical protein CAP_5271 [Chondromyces apiculatus DSM 436]